MSDYLEPAKGKKKYKVEICNLFGGSRQDISQYVASVSVTSSIDNPFMQMSCMLSDEQSIMRENDVTGDKSIVLYMSAGDGKEISGLFHINTMKFQTVNGRRSGGVELVGMTADHLNNASQKVMESKFRKSPAACTSIIQFIFDKYIKGDIDYNVSSSPAVKIDIPNQTPMQAISWLLERSQGVGENMFVLYQTFVGKKPKFQLDEVSILAQQGPKRTCVMTEGVAGSEAHEIDKEYIDGGNVRILDFHQDSGFDLHSMVQQGYAAKEYAEIDIVEKIVIFEKDTSTNTVMGSPRAPEVLSATRQMAGPRNTRCIYDIFCSDTDYFPDPKLKDASLKSKSSAAGMLSTRITVATYGILDCNAGDVVKILYKENNANPDRPEDKEYSRNYLVHTSKHMVSTNNECYTLLELVNDGQK
jgi:hypothetical protein